MAFGLIEGPGVYSMGWMGLKVEGKLEINMSLIAPSWWTLGQGSQGSVAPLTITTAIWYCERRKVLQLAGSHSGLHSRDVCLNCSRRKRGQQKQILASRSRKIISFCLKSPWIRIWPYPVFYDFIPSSLHLQNREHWQLEELLWKGEKIISSTGQAHRVWLSRNSMEGAIIRNHPVWFELS